MKELQELLKRIEALEDRVRLLEYHLAPEERSNQDERHFCAMLDCDQAVTEDGALCSACQACEDLQRAHDGFHGVDEPCDHAQPPEERSSYATLYSDDPTYGQFAL